MKTLTSTMKQLGHDAIDLIKMDIEGSEYAVLDEICQKNIKVGQILVEYHHHFSEIQVRKTKNSVKNSMKQDIKYSMFQRMAMKFHSFIHHFDPFFGPEKVLYSKSSS